MTATGMCNFADSCPGCQEQKTATYLKAFGEYIQMLLLYGKNMEEY